VLLPSRAELRPALATLLDAARSQLAELNVDLLVAPAPPSAELATTTASARELARSAHAVGVIWLRPGKDGVTLYFYEPSGPHLLMRQLALSPSEAAAAEEIAVVLRSAVSAVLDGVEIAMTEVALPELEPRSGTTPRTPPASGERPGAARAGRARPTLSGSVGYVGTALGQDTPWQSGGKLALTFAPGGGRFSAGAAYSLFPALTLRQSELTTRFRRHPIELVAGVRFAPGTLELEPQIALVAEAVRRTTERVEPPLAPRPPSQRWLWMTGVRLRGELALGSGLRLFSTPGADFLLNRVDPVVSGADGERTVISWFSVRPSLEVGLALGAW